MADLNIVVTSAGAQPQQPADVRAKLVANVVSTNPGYTDNLPLSLIEDIASTDVAAILLSDTAAVDSLNSLTPAGANLFTLFQQGQMFGIQLGTGSNTSVFLQFVGTPGFVVNQGFTVGDGVFQYITQEGAIIGSDRGDGLGVSALVFAVSPQAGSWAVPSGTVTTLGTSLPPGVILTVTNPQAGIPSTTGETAVSYRSRVYGAQLAVAGGMTTMLKTLLDDVDAVQPRLVSVIQAPANSGWQIIVGGGDPYQVAFAIQQSGVDLASLIGSTINVSGYTIANPGVITTDINHGLIEGQTATVSGATPGTYNSTGVVHVIDEKTFSIALNTTGFAAYVSGGVVTPNARNVVVSINDFPDTYVVPYITPPQQSVTVAFTWNTNSPNFASGPAVSAAGAPAIAAYINSIVVGQPINVSQLQDAFKSAVASILDPNFISRMVVSVAINGVVTAPLAGTVTIQGDPQSYFLCTVSDISVSQG
jgi:hypothetical protein